MQDSILPLGKLPPQLAALLVNQIPHLDPRVILGPGVGLDCAVLDFGETCLVMKSDPITFVTRDIGWYAVQICANDIATTGAQPRWFLTTLLLPEGKTTPEMVLKINEQVGQACQEKGISVIGGHTEITYGLDRPILVGTMIGEVAKSELITPKNAQPGNKLLLSKGIPIEGTAIIAKEFPEQLSSILNEAELQSAIYAIYDPGISVLRDAQLAVQAGKVTAMHDPTEGGLAAALWELAEACGHSLMIQAEKITIPPVSQKICDFFQLNPMATIASGALLMAVEAKDSQRICNELIQNGIPCSEIGLIEAGEPRVYSQEGVHRVQMPRPERDEITRLFETP
jgi:hydrogenase maturation factor